MSQQTFLGELADALIDSLFLGLRSYDVQIGYAPGLDASRSHGTIHATNRHGVSEQIAFVADKPARLKRPHPESIASLFKQAKRLGFMPRQIELRVGRYRRVYEEDKLEPVYQQRLS